MAHEAAYAERLHRWQTMTIEKIVSRVRLDGAAKVIEGGLRISGSLLALRSDLLNIRERIANFGRGQVNEELKRQA